MRLKVVEKEAQGNLKRLRNLNVLETIKEIVMGTEKLIGRLSLCCVGGELKVTNEPAMKTCRDYSFQVICNFNFQEVVHFILARPSTNLRASSSIADLSHGLNRCEARLCIVKLQQVLGNSAG